VEQNVSHSLGLLPDRCEKEPELTILSQGVCMRRYVPRGTFAFAIMEVDPDTTRHKSDNGIARQLEFIRKN